jgi:competence protein ComEC
VVLLAIAGLASLLVGLGGGGREAFPARRLCLTVLDVGQGDALLLDLPGGGRWLVDGGGRPGGDGDVGRFVVLPALRRAGVERIEVMVATHGDADHVGGLLPVLEQLPVGELWIPSRRAVSARLQALVDEAGLRGVPVRAADEGGAPSAAPPVEVALLHPWQGAADPQEGENDRSVVLKVGLGRVGLLLTGDVEQAAEVRLLAAGRVPRSALLKAPHHASRTSSTDAFVAAADPLVALAGIGRDNRFGFPHAATAARYLGRGAPLYWTGRHGALRACTDGWSLRVDHAPDGGRWRPLRRWDATAVDAWWRRGEAAAETPPPPRCAPEPPSWRKRPKRRRTSRPKRSRVEPEPPEEEPPTPPVLLDEREWQRRRKGRAKL